MEAVVEIETITDEQVKEFARMIVQTVYRDRAGIDQAGALSIVRAMLRRIVGEQIVAMECLGGLGDWSRDSLSKLLSDAAELEAAQLFGAFSEAFASAMQTHAEPSAEPTTAKDGI
jgi:hypothetical protein